MTKEEMFDKLCDIEFMLRNIDRQNGFKVLGYTEEVRIKRTIHKLRELQFDISEDLK